MKKSHMLFIGAVSLSMAALPAATPVFEEGFTQAQEGAPLKDSAGWSVHNGAGSAQATVTAGFAGLGARVTGNEQFRLLIPEDKAISLTSGGGGELRLKLRVMADNDGYTLTQVLLGQSDGVHGVSVRFNGGEHDGFSDNSIQVSTGGESWGKAAWETLPDSGWKRETWYEVVIAITAPDEATVTIREADSGTALVDQHRAGVIGVLGKFTQLNAIIIGNGGTARAFDFDDISLSQL